MDLPVGTPDKPFPFRDSIARAEFALNETMILAISESGIIRIWDISTLPKGDLRDVACSKYNEHDVFDFARRYGIKIEEPIREYERVKSDGCVPSN